MKMKKRILSLLAGGVLAATATMGLAACGKKDNTLTVWAPLAQKAMVEELVADFLKENTDIKLDIKVGAVGEDEARSQLQTDVKAGADVYGYANDQLVNIIKIGGAAFLNDSIVANLKNTDDLNAIDAGKIVVNGEDRYYGYPYAADNTFFMYYDADVVSEEQAQTLEGVLAACKAKKKLFLFNMMNSGCSWYLGSFYYGAGGTYDLEWADNGITLEGVDCNFNDEIGSSGYTIGQVASAKLGELASNNYFVTCDDSVISTRASAHEIGAVITGTWNYSTLSQYIPNLKAAPCPTYHSDLTGEDYHIAPFIGYKLMGVNPYSSHIQEAHRLAQYLTSEKAQQKRFEMYGIGPSNLAVAASSAVQANESLKVIQSQKSFSVVQQCLPDDYWTSFDTFGVDIYNGAKGLTIPALNAPLNTLIAGLIAAAG